MLSMSICELREVVRLAEDVSYQCRLFTVFVTPATFFTPAVVTTYTVDEEELVSYSKRIMRTTREAESLAEELAEDPGVCERFVLLYEVELCKFREAIHTYTQRLKPEELKEQLIELSNVKVYQLYHVKNDE